MLKKILIASVLIWGSLAVMAQDKKVAVFDPAGSVEGPIKEIVREEISSIIVNSGGFTVLERQLIDKVLEENKFQSGGLVDDSQISEIGKRMGANFVFVSSVTAMGGNNYYVSCKLIDVQTARIEKQRTGQTQKGSNDLINVVQKMVREMFNDAQDASVTQPVKPIMEEKSPLNISGVLIADGRKVFLNGKQLGKNEVRGMMANTDALRYYNKGLSKNRKGNWWIATGILAGAGVTAILIIEDDYYDVEEGGFLLTAIPVGMITTGIIVKSGSKKAVRNAVNMYNNSSKNTSNIELKFGFTGNGVGLALCF